MKPLNEYFLTPSLEGLTEVQVDLPDVATDFNGLEPEVIEEVSIENYLMAARDLERSVGLLASVTTLSDQHLKRGVFTQVSLEQYHDGVDALFLSHGFFINPKLIVPSMEDADTGGTGESKAREVIKKVTEWVKNFVAEMKVKFDNLKRAIAASGEAFREKAKQLAARVKAAPAEKVAEATEISAGNMKVIGNGNRVDPGRFKQMLNQFFAEPGLFGGEQTLKRLVNQTDSAEFSGTLSGYKDAVKARLDEFKSKWSSQTEAEGNVTVEGTTPADLEGICVIVGEYMAKADVVVSDTMNAHEATTKRLEQQLARLNEDQVEEVRQVQRDLNAATAVADAYAALRKAFNNACAIALRTVNQIAS